MSEYAKEQELQAGKGNPGSFTEFSGLVYVSNPRARRSQAIGFSASSGKTRLPSPPAPQASLIIRLFHTPTAFPPPKPGLRVGASPQLRCSLSTEQSVQGGDQDAPSPEGLGAAAL